MLSNLKMDWSLIKLFGGILVAVLGCIMAFVGYMESKSDKEQSKIENEKASEERKHIDKNVDSAKDGIKSIDEKMDNLSQIGYIKHESLIKKYPYGYVIFGLIDGKNIASGPIELDLSLNFKAEWDYTEVAEIIEGENTLEYYELHLYEVYQGNIADVDHEDFRGAYYPQVTKRVPRRKSETPVDITVGKIYNEPHMFFEILKEYDGSEFVFVIGFRKFPEYDKWYKENFMQDSKN